MSKTKILKMVIMFIIFSVMFLIPTEKCEAAYDGSNAKVKSIGDTVTIALNSSQRKC